jgi:hypothetical protein
MCDVFVRRQHKVWGGGVLLARPTRTDTRFNRKRLPVASDGSGLGLRKGGGATPLPLPVLPPPGCQRLDLWSMLDGS